MAANQQLYADGRRAAGGWRFGIVEAMNDAGVYDAIQIAAGLGYRHLAEELELAAARGEFEEAERLVAKVSFLLEEETERGTFDGPDYDGGIPSLFEEFPECWGEESLSAADPSGPALEWDEYDEVAAEPASRSGKRDWSDDFLESHGWRGKSHRTDERDRSIRRLLHLRRLPKPYVIYPKRQR